MRTQRIATLATLMLAFTMTTTSVLAQNREGRRGADRSARSGDQDRGNRGGSRGDVAVSRSGSRGESARGSQQSRPSENRSYSNSNRSTDNRSYGSGSSGSRQSDSSRGASRGSIDRQSGYNRNSGRTDYGRAVSRGDSRYDNRGGYSGRGYGSGSYGSSGYGSSYGYRDYGYGSRRYGSYDRNAWRGRLRFGLGISIFAGRSYPYRFDYGWRPSFDYRYSMRAGLAYGGMAFLLNPADAEVYIDGEYVGIARDFGGQPVPLASGYHRIELYAPGYEPVAFDINVLPGQVIPYRGDLYPVY